MVFNRFRWVFCQLEMLRNCLPQNVRRVIRELPASLDETYERMLKEILKANPDQAHRLLQCLTVATRPLRVAELAGVLALDFDEAKDGIPALNKDWLWDGEQHGVLSVCSNLIVIVDDDDDWVVGDDWGGPVVQFAHFSVKEFLTSKRLANLKADISRFHIQLESAHTVLTQACLATLLHSDWNHLAKNRPPLSHYASRYWVDHAQFKNVSSRVEDGMRRLFDPTNLYFTAWLNSYDLDREWYTFVRAPTSPSSSLMFIAPVDTDSETDSVKTDLVETDLVETDLVDTSAPSCLYYAALCGFRDLTKHLIAEYPQHLNAEVGRNKSPLVAALHNRHLQVANLLHQNGAVFPIGHNGYTLLHAASKDSSMDVIQWLLDIGADVNAQDDDDRTPLHFAAGNGDLKVVQTLLAHSADVNVTAARYIGTPLHEALRGRYIDVVRLLIDNGADASRDLQGLLLLALEWRSAETVQFFIRLGADVNARFERDRTPLHLALCVGCDEAVRVLTEHGADVNTRDRSLKTPLHAASARGHVKTVQLLIEHGLDVNARDGSHSTPLHLASSEHFVEVMHILIERGADVHARDQDESTHLHLVSSSAEGFSRMFGDIDFNTLCSCARLLIEHGASINAYDRNHKTPLHRAVSSARFWGSDADLSRLLLKMVQMSMRRTIMVWLRFRLQRHKVFTALHSCY